MKHLITIAALILSMNAYAYSDKEVGYCAAFHLLLKHYDNVSEIAKKAKQLPTMQMYAREFVGIASKNIDESIKLGKSSCRAIGYATN